MDELRPRNKPCEEPGKASVEAGFVLLDGPDGVAVAMTAEAARLTAESLLRAAQEAVQAGAGYAPDLSEPQ